MEGDAKTMRASVERALSMTVDEFAQAMGDDGMTVQDRMAVAMAAEAMGGNVRAAQYIRDVMDGWADEKADKPRARVTAFDRIAKQYAQGPARKPGSEVPNSA